MHGAGNHAGRQGGRDGSGAEGDGAVDLSRGAARERRQPGDAWEFLEMSFFSLREGRMRYNLV